MKHILSLIGFLLFIIIIAFSCKGKSEPKIGEYFYFSAYVLHTSLKCQTLQSNNSTRTARGVEYIRKDKFKNTNVLFCRECFNDDTYEEALRIADKNIHGASYSCVYDTIPTGFDEEDEWD